MVMELSGLKLHLFACLFFKLLIAQELRLWTQVLLDIIYYEENNNFFSLSWTKVNIFFFFFDLLKVDYWIHYLLVYFYCILNRDGLPSVI